MSYKVVVADVTELTEEVLEVSFDSRIPMSSTSRSADIESTITVKGRISYDADKLFMRDAGKKLAAWSLVKPEETDSYKKLTVEYIHTEAPRKYEFSHAFVVSYHEEFDTTEGKFELVLKQKKDRVNNKDGIKIE